MIIGLTGRMASGKGTVADVLRSRGFGYYSLSDVIRDELAARGIPESRHALTEMGNELRSAQGPAALALKILERLVPDRHFIIDSIRNPAEVEVLKAARGDFQLWLVDASLEVRFERLRARGRVGDVDTLDAFRAQEERELASDDPNTQQLLATEALADTRLINDGSVEDLQAVVDALLPAD